jgi:hypothetical protein
LQVAGPYHNLSFRFKVPGSRLNDTGDSRQGAKGGNELENTKLEIRNSIQIRNPKLEIRNKLYLKSETRKPLYFLLTATMKID